MKTFPITLCGWKVFLRTLCVWNVFLRTLCVWKYFLWTLCVWKYFLWTLCVNVVWESEIMCKRKEREREQSEEANLSCCFSRSQSDLQSTWTTCKKPFCSSMRVESLFGSLCARRIVILFQFAGRVVIQFIYSRVEYFQLTRRLLYQVFSATSYCGSWQNIW